MQKILSYKPSVLEFQKPLALKNVDIFPNLDHFSDKFKRFMCKVIKASEASLEHLEILGGKCYPDLSNHFKLKELHPPVNSRKEFRRLVTQVSGSLEYLSLFNFNDTWMADVHAKFNWLPKFNRLTKLTFHNCE